MVNDRLQLVLVLNASGNLLQLEPCILSIFEGGGQTHISSICNCVLSIWCWQCWVLMNLDGWHCCWVCTGFSIMWWLISSCCDSSSAGVSNLFWSICHNCSWVGYFLSHRYFTLFDELTHIHAHCIACTLEQVSILFLTGLFPYCFHFWIRVVEQIF